MGECKSHKKNGFTETRVWWNREGIEGQGVIQKKKRTGKETWPKKEARRGKQGGEHPKHWGRGGKAHEKRREKAIG